MRNETADMATVKKKKKSDEGGIGSWALARVPLAGAFLSTAVIAPIHAVSLAVVRERVGATATAAADT